MGEMSETQLFVGQLAAAATRHTGGGLAVVSEQPSPPHLKIAGIIGHILGSDTVKLVLTLVSSDHLHRQHAPTVSVLR
jgi:hypothetical protein